MNTSFINIEGQWLNQTMHWFESPMSISLSLCGGVWCTVLFGSQFFSQSNFLVKLYICITSYIYKVIYIYILYKHYICKIIYYIYNFSLRYICIYIYLGSLIGLSLPNAHTYIHTHNLISNCFIIYLFSWIPCDYLRYILLFSN